MRKAINTGIITGLILSIILILGTMCRILLPADTTGANLTFSIIFVSAIAIVLWIAMEKYCRSNSPSWSNLSVLSIITSITTAVLFSTASFIYTRYFSSGYLSDLMEQSKQNWLDRNYSAQSIATQGEWTWYKTPWNFAFNNLQVMLVVLFVISLFIAFVYYSKNRNKVPQHESHDNHELIF
jgi:magnesium-transporting ATPase (P-type)